MHAQNHVIQLNCGGPNPDSYRRCRSFQQTRYTNKIRTIRSARSVIDRPDPRLAQPKPNGKLTPTGKRYGLCGRPKTLIIKTKSSITEAIQVILAILENLNKPMNDKKTHLPERNHKKAYKKNIPINSQEVQ